jgi:hypothetical protein
VLSTRSSRAWVSDGIYPAWVNTTLRACPEAEYRIAMANPVPPKYASALPRFLFLGATPAALHPLKVNSLSLRQDPTRTSALQSASLTADFIHSYWTDER